MNRGIFREYDIRGIYKETLTETDAFAIGVAFAKDKNRVIVGYDGRISSPALKNALIVGAIAQNAEIIDIGLVATPVLYFAYKLLEGDGGVMVTGSHNPPSHNGFKFLDKNGSLYGDRIQQIGEDASRVNIVATAKSANLYQEINEQYIDYLLSKITLQKKLKIAWDSGNGATGEVVEMFVKKLPGEHILLNTKIDGTFPSHHPDPSVPENMQQLIAVVRENDCDFGIGFDGDGDRIGVVDNKGRLLFGDELMMVLSRLILPNHPGAKVIADVKSSDILFQEITKYSGVPIMWKTGHSLIKAKMKEENALFAGEMSGHIFFQENHGFDDGIYAAMKLASLLCATDFKLSEIVDMLPARYNSPEIRLECDDIRKFAIIEEIKANLTQKGELSSIDGVRFKTEKGWWLVRASNTQNCLVMRCEAYHENDLGKVREELQNILKMVGL